MENSADFWLISGWFPNFETPYFDIDFTKPNWAQGVVDMHVNFWVFLQLFRSMRRRQDGICVVARVSVSNVSAFPF